jgi:3-oxoacyl-[acyl-carrier-protein] synthase-1
MTPTLAILGTGLVTSVGLDAPSTCAAIRAKVTNPTDTQFIDSAGRWIMAHQVDLPLGHRGTSKLAVMAAMAITEALGDLPREAWGDLPLLLCTAEPTRPGRVTDLDNQLFAKVQSLLGTRFHARSALLPQGRVGAALALARARELVVELGKPVVIAAVDSLLNAACLTHFEKAGRLLTESNSDGFMPGEGAGALLIGAPDGSPRLCCTGLGFASEKAHIDSGEPLRAEGLTHAVQQAVAEAGVDMHLMDFRVTDISGEQYYFKEASLALSRSMRRLKEEFDLWHPAECTGETGALAGISVIALAEAACRKAYGPGPAILAHWSNDNGLRAAATLHYGAR